MKESNKKSNKDELICYCFKKTKEELLQAVIKGDEEAFVADVKAKMKDPGCFCATANPSGKCCMADMQAFITAAKEDGSRS